MIHGDLKGVSAHGYPLIPSFIDVPQPNILVDDSGHARITDFCLAQDILSAVSVPERWSMRWTAPEILMESGTPSAEADIFSLGMVMFEVRYDSTNVRPPQANRAVFSIHSVTRPLPVRFRSVTKIPRRR